MIQRYTYTRLPAGLTGPVLILGLVALLSAACTPVDVQPRASPTPTAAPAVTRAATETVQAATPTLSAVPNTPTLSAVPNTPTTGPPPMDLCREYLRLSAAAGEAQKEAVATSYRCHNAHVDATGQSDASADWVVVRGTPIQLEIDVGQAPTETEARLYPGVGASASFMRWPEELPTGVEAVAEWQPAPGTRFEVLPQAPAGPYSLVVRAAWGEEVEVFYALGLTLAEAAPEETPAPPSIAFLPERAPDEVLLEVVRQIGGYSLALAVEQGRVYLGIGPRLVVLDGYPPAGQSPTIGQSEVLPGIVRDIHPGGVHPAGAGSAANLAYVAAGEAGLLILDVTGPSKPQLVGSLPVPGAAQGVVVAPGAGLAYVASHGPPGPGQAGWVSVVDVSQTEAPTLLAAVKAPGQADGLALVDRYAYVACEGGLWVLDLSDPAAPGEVAEVSLPQPARDLAVAGDVAYVAAEGLHVFDVSDPANPKQVGQVKSRFPPHAVAVSGERAYLSETFCEMGGCGTAVHIVDVSDPAQPQEIGEWFAKAAVERVAVRDDALYLASWQEGLQVVEVSDAGAPEQIGQYKTLGAVEAVAVSGGLAYVSDEAQAGLQVLELDETAGPRPRGVAESARWAGGYEIVGPYAYVPMWVSGLSIVDVRDPDNPQQAALVELGQAEQAVVVGERAYVTIGYEGLAVLDVADPLEPQVLGTLPLEGLAEGLAAPRARGAGDRAYVAVDDGEQSTLYVVDATDPSQPGVVGRVALRGPGLNIALAPEAPFAYVAVADCTYYLGAAQCSGGLEVVDLGDPSRPRSVLAVEVPGGAFDIALAGRYAFVAAGHGGVWAIDLSDPGTPRAVGWRDTAGRARSIVEADGRLYVADGAGGLLVMVYALPAPAN